MVVFLIPNDVFDCYIRFNALLILIIMISVHMHGIVSENRVIFELRSAYLYPESEVLLVTRQMTFVYKDL